MLVSIPQMTHYHSLDEKEIHIECNGKALERVNVTVTPQNVIIAAKRNNIDTKCDKVFNAKCNNFSNA